MIWWGNDEKYTACQYAKDIGLYIENAHLSFSRANDIWEKENGDYTRQIIADIQECAKYDIPMVVIHINDFRECPIISEIGLNNMKSIVSCAEEYNVKVAVENCRFFAPIKYILDNIDSDILGFCYDSGHENIDSENIDYLKHFGKRLFAVHLNDNLGDRDAHLLPYDGSVDWEKMKKYFADIPTINHTSLEVNYNRKYEESSIYSALNAEEFLQLAIKRARKIYEGL